MKLFFTGAPVSPEWTDVLTAYGVTAVAGPRCTTVSIPRTEAPSTGLARTRAFAAVPSTGGVTGEVSVQDGVGGLRPTGMPSRKRQQHIDLDPQRPRPSGGCG